MPNVLEVETANQFTRITEVVEYWKRRFDIDGADLGLNAVYTFSQKMNRDYPAILINPAPAGKELYATHTWLYTWRVMFYVFHAKLTQDKMNRSKADVTLAENITDYIERDKTLMTEEQPDGLVIFGYVEDTAAGALPPFVTKSDAVLCTRLRWFATSEGRFD